MKRFDRLIAILLQLQTSRLLRAADLALKFGVSERTIYRDMRSLENAGVPLVAETGLGYYLERDYQLPAVNFSPDEAVALLVGVKGVQAHVAGTLSERAETAMDKLLAVMDNKQRENIRDLQSRIAVDGVARLTNSAEDRRYDTCQNALLTRRLLHVCYTASYNGKSSERTVEPIGLSHYGGHWHLIAWCQLRDAMRDFRLDRMTGVETLAAPCPTRPDQTLDAYYQSLQQKHTLTQLKIGFDASMAHVVGMDRYRHGYLGSDHSQEGLEVMNFLTAYPEYLGRWLLQFTNAVKTIDKPEFLSLMRRLHTELAQYKSPATPEGERQT